MDHENQRCCRNKVTDILPYVSVCLSDCLSVCLSASHMLTRCNILTFSFSCSIFLSVSLSVCISACVCLSISLPIYRPLYPLTRCSFHILSISRCVCVHHFPVFTGCVLFSGQVDWCRPCSTHRVRIWNLTAGVHPPPHVFLLPLQTRLLHCDPQSSLHPRRCASPVEFVVLPFGKSIIIWQIFSFYTVSL